MKGGKRLRTIFVGTHIIGFNCLVIRRPIVIITITFAVIFMGQLVHDTVWETPHSFQHIYLKDLANLVRMKTPCSDLKHLQRMQNISKGERHFRFCKGVPQFGTFVNLC